MDNKITAQDIASYGRNGDTMLVHMTPDEVGGLQALAMAQGGSLTINPDTGLPEASFLSDTFKAIAPTLIGAGLAYFGGMPAWAAGLTVGGVEAARTKDLGRGLLAGLGAYGGAGMGEAFASMGAAPAATTGATVSQQGLKLAPEIAGEATSTAIGEGSKGVFAKDVVARGGVENFVQPAGFRTGLGTTAGPYTSAYGYSPSSVIPDVVTNIEPITAFTPDYGFSSVSELGGPAEIVDYSTQAVKGQYIPYGNVPKRYIPIENYEVAGSNYLPGRAITAEKYVMPGDAISYTGTEYGKQIIPQPSQFSKGLSALGEEGGLKEFGNRYAQAMEGPTVFGETPLWSGKTGALAGLAGTAGNIAYRAGAFDQPALNVATPEGTSSTYAGPYSPSARSYRQPTEEEILASGGREFTYFTPSNPVPGYEPYTAARGGLLTLNKMAAGRYLQGAGDGTSDSIPATIGGNQPARLADGEFVLDARTVSEIGNGSSDAGARKLYALMDNVHKARQNADRGKPSGADNLLKGLTATA